MVALVIIYSSISGVAGLKGYKSPLFGAFGIIAYIVLQFPAAAYMPDRSQFEQCIVSAIASIGGISFFVLLLPYQDARAAPKRSNVPYALIGVVSLVLSIGVLFLWFAAMTEPGVYAAPFLMGAAMLFTGALACFRLHKQQAMPSALQVLRADRRAPVLFLRSFQSDAMRVKPWGSSMLPMFPDWMGKSFEEFLAPMMGRLGPFIALGNPDDYLPTLGAVKVYQRDDSWQATVLEYVDRAQLVLLLEGSTKGLSWELRQIRERCSPRSLFLVTPTRKFPRTGWRDFAHLLREAGFEVSSDDVGPGAVVGFDDNFKPLVLKQNATSAAHYCQAVVDWFAPPKVTKPTPEFLSNLPAKFVESKPTASSTLMELICPHCGIEVLAFNGIYPCCKRKVAPAALGGVGITSKYPRDGV